MTKIHALTFLITISSWLTSVSHAQDPLPSWNDGAAKKSLIDFVQRVTDASRDDFVPAAERIAVFDNDGTLWCEYPVPNQAAFGFDEIKRMLPDEPEWKDDPAVKALLDGDIGSLLSDGHKGLFKIVALTHSGMTTDAFDSRVSNWLASAKHPRFGVKYDQTIYQPMLEVLAYLRANEFETWIVSGGGQDFMRVFAEKTYGIPPQQIVGSHGKLKYELKDGIPTLTKTLDALFVDDKEGKPVGIAQFIGRRPIACFGNSNGDQAMMEYTTMGNPRPSFGLIVHHTDADREYAYDSNPPGSGELTTALEVAPERGWTVVDMKRDWKVVFPDISSRGIFGKWLAEDIDGRGVVDRAQSTLEIAEDGTVSGSTAVNRFGGKATIDGNSITFGPLATTRRAGPPALMDQEARFTRALEATNKFRIDQNGLLYFLDAEDKPRIRFSKL